MILVLALPPSHSYTVVAFADLNLKPGRLWHPYKFTWNGVGSITLYL